jgi:xanthine dehydrogenase accessory factor
MLLGPDGEVFGSVSGGCVEGAVYESAQTVLASGVPALERFGYSDETAFPVGLTCGGSLEIFVERHDPSASREIQSVLDYVGAARPVALATVIDHPDPNLVGSHVVVPPRGRVSPRTRAGARLLAQVAEPARALLARDETATMSLPINAACPDQLMRVFVRALAPSPRMLVFGAIDFATSMADMGRLLGYEVTVCDARATFATRARFPNAHSVVVDWPHRYLQAELAEGRVDDRTAICVLTHDPKFDIPLLTVALGLPAGAYVGAMGSRRTHQDRVHQLRAEGMTEAQLARLSSPIGLDIGARTPEETAVSIAAELIALRRGGTGLQLRHLSGSIHREFPLMTQPPAQRFASAQGR